MQRERKRIRMAVKMLPGLAQRENDKRLATTTEKLLSPADCANIHRSDGHRLVSDHHRIRS